MDTAIFVIGKLVGLALRVELWLILLLALALVLVSARRRRGAQAVLGVTLAGLVVLAYLPVGAPLLRPLEMRYPARPALDSVDGIVVLGGGEDPWAATAWDMPAFNEGGERFAAAVALARRFPNATVVFTGGSGQLSGLLHGDGREAAVAGRFFRAQGIEPERIRLERSSRTTAENATHALRRVGPSEGEVWVLVTSAFHMPRAMRSFARAGWPGLVAWPVDHRSGAFLDGIGLDLPGHMALLNTALKEHVGLLAYDVLGR